MTENYTISKHSWQSQLKDTINTVDKLCYELSSELNIKYSDLASYINHKLHIDIEPDPNFKVKIPKYYLNKIINNIKITNNYLDPLLLQVLPVINQIENTKHNTKKYIDDPLQESKYIKSPGLIHKYYNRVLLTLTGACAIHCRYCFRQNFDYNSNIITNKNRDQQLRYIKNNSNITEVILSGGDPLCVNNNYLNNLLSDLSNIEHLNTIRFHTRTPIVMPDRLDQGFLDILNNYNKFNFIIVTHCNHPNELDDYIKAKINFIKNNYNNKYNNLIFLNQTVLLKHINNNADILIKLSNKLFNTGIMPYYLHILDPVTNANHFEVDLDTAKDLHNKISAKLSGYLVPKLVQEIPGYLYKKILV